MTAAAKTGGRHHHWSFHLLSPENQGGGYKTRPPRPREDGDFTRTDRYERPTVARRQSVQGGDIGNATAGDSAATGSDERTNTTAMDHKVGPEATTNRVQRANREGGERQGMTLGKGDGDPPAEGKGTLPGEMGSLPA